MEHTVTEISRGVEVDLVTRTGSWSVRLAEQLDGALSVILVDHLRGCPVLAELIAQDRP
jgi:hypothetical protein